MSQKKQNTKKVGVIIQICPVFRIYMVSVQLNTWTCLFFVLIFLFYSLSCRRPAGLLLCAPHTAQSSGSGTDFTAGIQRAAFSLDTSQRPRAAHQQPALQIQDTVKDAADVSRHSRWVYACMLMCDIVCMRGCSTWWSNILLTGSCELNRGISCSMVAFWPTTATRWSSPRSARRILIHQYTYYSCNTFFFLACISYSNSFFAIFHYFLHHQYLNCMMFF